MGRGQAGLLTGQLCIGSTLAQFALHSLQLDVQRLDLGAFLGETGFQLLLHISQHGHDHQQHSSFTKFE